MAKRAFSTQMKKLDEPVWAPLEAVARISNSCTELPSFHPGEFMYMYAVCNRRKGLTIHLYKHMDTRRYLNLDDAGHAYRYCGSARTDDDESGGMYRLHASLAVAINALELWLFDDEPRLFRSFPPSEWPGGLTETTPSTGL